MGLDTMILMFWMLSFKSDFSLSSFIFIKMLFSSSLLYAIRVVSSAYLRLLIFTAILISACDSSSPAYKQSDNIQPWHTPFPMLNQSFVPYLVLTVASWPKYRFLRKQVRWSGTLISLKLFHSLLWSTQTRFQCSQWSRGRCFFFWNSLVFSMIQLMLAIWFLVPLPFLNSACIFGSFQFI